ncbi:MAG: PAS domain S-box protein [Methylocystaceae bacterium]|nr:PAS domain S-box protein [Methylocystaceae bacterium]
MQQTNDRHRVFFEASADAMLVIDDGVFVDCNQSTLDMLGFSSKEELFLTHPAKLSPPIQPDGRSSYEKADEMIELAMKEGSNRFNWVHVRKTGENFPVEVLLTALPFEGATILNVVWRDITSHVKLEEELIEQRDLLEQQVAERTQDLEKALNGARLLGEVVKQSGTSTIITDAKGKIQYINPAFTQINGYTPAEVYGKTPGILNSGLQDAAFYQDMWTTINSGKIWSGTLQNARKNGEVYWVRLKIAPVTNEQGLITNFVGIETDISEFIEAKEKAERANKAKSEFLSSMSHELRTPLNAINGFAQLLEMDRQTVLTPKQSGHIEQIKNAGAHLLELIDEILDLARVESGKMAFHFEDVDTRVMLKECIGLSSASYNQLNVVIVDKTARNLPALHTDSTRVKQVFLNLISNAKKYNVENGTVYLESKVLEDGMLRLMVRDTGPGIPPKYQSQLFKPFSRLGAEKSNIEGTGIGLVLTKQIVEEMQGRIGFESTMGVGTTFWVDFPIYQEMESAAS